MANRRDSAQEYNGEVQDLSVSLFGTPQIRRGNEDISIQRRKDLALLIYLVVKFQFHSRDTLAALLWPDLSQTDARSNLRKSLSRLKLQLGEDCLLISPSGAGLNPKLPLDLDIARFKDSIQCIRDHEHPHNENNHGLPNECQQSLEEAAKLYRADFLTGFSVSDSSVFEEWQFFQYEGLRKDLAEVLEHLTRQYLAFGEYPAGIETCRRWLALDRFDELPHRQLMHLYALSGQNAAALHQFEELTRILHEELDTQPEDETQQLYEAIKSKKFQVVEKTVKAGSKSIPASKKPVETLPTYPVPFIGRKKELEQISQLLTDPACRLLTLLGPGGNGKTRLAVEIASVQNKDTRSPFKDGIWFLPLAPLREQQSIVTVMADCFQVTGHVTGTDTRQKLVDRLQGRQMLLVLDNFEHLITGDNLGLLSEILARAPKSRILVTSREQLNIRGETIFRVEGLESPSRETAPLKPDADFPPSAFSALQLFEQSARRVDLSFRMTPENYPVIARICQNLQGMPLAIELAASWIAVLSPQEIMEEITRSPDFLESNLHDLPDRQRSLRAVFDSSWNLLDRRTQPILKALSVFRTSFTREAAQAVSGASVKTLLELTSKSWVQRLSSGRYQLHELLRQFSFEKLSKEKITFDQVQGQFCGYYARYASSLWEKMKGPEQAQAFSGIEAEFENIHTAWLWLAARNNLETAIDDILPILFHYCERQGRFLLLTELIETGLRTIEAGKPDPDRQRMEIILCTARGAFFMDGYPIRFASYEGIFATDQEAIQHAWSLSWQMKLSDLWIWGIILAFIYGQVINLEDGVKQLEKLLAYFQMANQKWESAYTCLHLGKLLNPGMEVNSVERMSATNYLSRALDIFTSMGDRINAGQVLIQLGESKISEQDLHGAVEQWEAARSSLLAVGEWEIALTIYWRIGDVYLQLGLFQEAYDCYQEIAQTYLEHGRMDQVVSALSKLSYEKVRYGDISEALHLREQCIEMIRETGLEYQYAWNDWEMGELLRVDGKLEAAQTWFERSRPIFEKYQDSGGRAFYFRGMGDLALANHEYSAARAAFSTCADLAIGSQHVWTLVYALTGTAKAELRLNDLKSARQHLNEAGRLIPRVKDKGVTLVMLSVLADLYACLGESVQAIELGSLVENHVSSWHETRSQATRLLAGLKKSVTTLEFKQAHKRGKTLDLWNTVGDLIPSLKHQSK